MAQAQDSERAAAVLLDRASFRYVDESERGLEAEAGSAAPASGSRVDDVSLSVAPGRCLVLCGRSGDGKSTVLRLVDGLAGTFFPGDLTGVVEVCGADVRRLAPRERTERLGVVMQDPRSQFFMGTVGDEIAFSAENLGVDPAETVRRVHAAAETCGVEGLLGEKLSELSSGQKQRVALAAAIACGPAVLVLDEPTSNLDAQGSEALVRILAELKRRGTAVVVSEHRLHQLLPVADAYVCLRAGRVVERWSADAFARLGLEDMAAPAPGVGGVAPAASGWRVEGLTYRYPSTKRGIRDFDAAFACGAVTVIEGPNGAGKTTLAKVLCGATREQAGRVTFDGRPVPRRERSGRSTSCEPVGRSEAARDAGGGVLLGRRPHRAGRAHERPRRPRRARGVRVVPHPGRRRQGRGDHHPRQPAGRSRRRCRRGAERLGTRRGRRASRLPVRCRSRTAPQVRACNPPEAPLY